MNNASCACKTICEKSSFMSLKSSCYANSNDCKIGASGRHNDEGMKVFQSKGRGWRYYSPEKVHMGNYIFEDTFSAEGADQERLVSDLTHLLGGGFINFFINGV